MLFNVFILAAAVLAVLWALLSGLAIWQMLLAFVGLFVGLNLLFFILLFLATLHVNTDKPIEKQSRLCRFGCVSAISLAIRYCSIRLHVTGMDKLPGEGNFLMVCNHRSLFDPLLMLYNFREQNLSFVSKPSNMRLPLIGKLAHGVGCLPIDRENNREALKTILKTAQHIKSGLCSMCIYPEGTRSRDGRLLPFHSGSFKAAQKAACPLVICSIQGTEKVWDNFLRRHTDIYLDVLEVMSAESVQQTQTVELADYSRKLIADRIAELENKGDRE